MGGIVPRVVESAIRIDGHGGRIGDMPGQHPQIYRSHRYSVSPKDVLHRRKWPFFFEQTNYSFLVAVERTDEKYPTKDWPTIELAVRFENDDFTQRTLTLPDLAIGEKGTLAFDEVYVAHPGQTAIVIPIRWEASGKPDDWLNLYSYRVRTQESLWVSIAAVIFGVVSLSVSIFVPICTANLRKAPVVQGPVINNIISLQTPTVTPTTTPIPLPPAGASTPS